MEKIEYWVDGGIANNGNTNNSGIAYGGIGIVLVNNNKIFKKYKISYKDSTENLTNNKLELEAVIKALKIHLKKYNNINNIEIYSDSAYVVNSYNNHLEKWLKNDWKILTGQPVKNLNLWINLLNLKYILKDCNISLKIIKTKGHSNNKFNNLADELATRAKLKAMKEKQNK
jgi:ribonuclease HI